MPGKSRRNRNPWQARLAVEFLEDRRPLSVTPLTLGDAPDPPRAAEMRDDATSQPPGPAAGHEQQAERDQGPQPADRDTGENHEHKTDQYNNPTTSNSGGAGNGTPSGTGSGTGSGNGTSAGNTGSTPKGIVTGGSSDTPDASDSGSQNSATARSTFEATPAGKSRPVAASEATADARAVSVSATEVKAMAQDPTTSAVTVSGIDPSTPIAATEGALQATAAPAKTVQAVLPVRLIAADLPASPADMVREQDHSSSADRQPTPANSPTPLGMPDAAVRLVADTPEQTRANPQAQSPNGQAGDTAAEATDGAGAPDQVVASLVDAEISSLLRQEEVTAAVSGLHGADLPFDASALNRGVDGFFQRLNQLSSQLGLSLGSVPLHSWAVAAVLSAVAVEAARRQFRSSARSRHLGGADPADTLTWSLTLTGSVPNGTL